MNLLSHFLTSVWYNILLLSIYLLNRETLVYHRSRRQYDVIVLGQWEVDWSTMSKRNKVSFISIYAQDGGSINVHFPTCNCVPVTTKSAFLESFRFVLGVSHLMKYYTLAFFEAVQVFD